jgi:hypothetical protein
MILNFLDPSDLSDLRSFLTRAKRLDEKGLVKLKVDGDVLGVYVSPIFTASLLDKGLTVLGLRTIRVDSEPLDAAFEISAILERLMGLGEGLELKLPPSQSRAAWTGITPPRHQWQRVSSIPNEMVSVAAEQGIAEVAQAIPDAIGASIANRVRQQVWGRGFIDNLPYPAGAAFALVGLGFLNPLEEVAVFEAPGWVRFSTSFGHVLAKR